MALSGNGTASTGNGTAPRPTGSARCPRRVVLLRDGEQSEVERVLVEYADTDVSGRRLHADVQRLAREHRGLLVAAEWLGPLGWTRFLWCRQ